MFSTQKSRIADHETRIIELEEEVGKNAVKNEDQDNKIANLMKRINELEHEILMNKLKTQDVEEYMIGLRKTIVILLRHNNIDAEGKPKALNLRT